MCTGRPNLRWRAFRPGPRVQIIFFSDAHLTRDDKPRVTLANRFIRDVCASADMVCIMGDIFEFYHGHDGYFYPWYQEIMEALREIGSGKRPVYFIEGNHEFGLGKDFETSTGVTLVENLTLDIDGKRTFVSHGDEVGSPYLRKLLKSRFTLSLMDLFGPELTWKIAMFCRIFLSKRKKAYEETVRERFRRYAEKKLSEGYDAVVLAHSHIPDLCRFDADGKVKTYLNAGDLCECLSYGEYTTAGGFAVRTYDPGTTYLPQPEG